MEIATYLKLQRPCKFMHTAFVIFHHVKRSIFIKAEYYIIFIRKKWPTWFIKLVHSWNTIFVINHRFVVSLSLVAFCAFLWGIVFVETTIKAFFFSLVKCFLSHYHSRWWSHFVSICGEIRKSRKKILKVVFRYIVDR